MGGGSKLDPTGTPTFVLVSRLGDMKVIRPVKKSHFSKRFYNGGFRGTWPNPL